MKKIIFGLLLVVLSLAISQYSNKQFLAFTTCILGGFMFIFHAVKLIIKIDKNDEHD